MTDYTVTTTDAEDLGITFQAGLMGVAPPSAFFDQQAHAMILPWSQRQQASVAPAAAQDVAAAWLAADPTTQQQVMNDLGMTGSPPAARIATPGVGIVMGPPIAPTPAP